MDTALNDAASRLVSHPRVTIDANIRAQRRTRHVSPQELTPKTLAERCPGSSDAGYGRAVNDGLTQTRK